MDQIISKRSHLIDSTKPVINSLVENVSQANNMKKKHQVNDVSSGKEDTSGSGDENQAFTGTIEMAGEPEYVYDEDNKSTSTPEDSASGGDDWIVGDSDILSAMETTSKKKKVEKHKKQTTKKGKNKGKVKAVAGETDWIVGNNDVLSDKTKKKISRKQKKKKKKKKQPKRNKKQKKKHNQGEKRYQSLSSGSGSGDFSYEIKEYSPEIQNNAMSPVDLHNTVKMRLADSKEDFTTTEHHQPIEMGLGEFPQEIQPKELKQEFPKQGLKHEFQPQELKQEFQPQTLTELVAPFHSNYSENRSSEAISNMVNLSLIHI